MIKKEYLLVRYSDKHAPAGGTMAAHLDVLKFQGVVWFGKFGSPISATKIQRIIDGSSLENYRNILLLNSAANQLYSGRLIAQSAMADGEVLQAVPEYIKGQVALVSTWLKIVELRKVPMSTLSEFVTISSAQPLAETVSKSMSGFFFARRDHSN